MKLPAVILKYVPILPFSWGFTERNNSKTGDLKLPFPLSSQLPLFYKETQYLYIGIKKKGAKTQTAGLIVKTTNKGALITFIRDFGGAY